ncbi:hypothetical protein BWP28_17225 [Mycobacterium tuberculosis]|nr:hypothetical protein BWP12_13185 [Mycobacterium tuberculosis]OOD82624.1 hypothetical protein BWP15_02635 [Mycobacterium tuberculosis]OOD88340.1 hypothetical protein BWP28_17225 [Mycobacterium tuberculosis]
MEVLPFIVNHVVLMKSSRIPGPTQPTVVRELVAVGEPSYTALPAGLPHHPRPQRGGSSRAAPVLVDDSMPHPGTRRCCELPQPGHQFPKPGQFRRQSWSRRSLSRAQTLSRKRRALQPLPRPPYLTTTPSKRHYKRYKPPKYAHSGPRLEDQPVQCLLTLFAFDRKQVP